MIDSVLLALPVRFKNALNMHEFAQNCVCNAQELLAAGALPQTPVGGAYDAPPNSLVGWGVVLGKPPTHTSLPPSLRRLASSSSGDSSPMFPPPQKKNNFLDPPLARLIGLVGLCHK